jgi:hypothetical protein
MMRGPKPTALQQNEREAGGQREESGMSREKQILPIVNYGSPESQSPTQRKRFFDVFWLIQLIAWYWFVTGFSWLLIMIVPMYARAMDGLKVSLPSSTEMVLAVGLWLHRTHIWLVLWTVPVVVPALVYCRTRNCSDEDRRLSAFRSAAAAVILMFILTLWTVMCILMPFLTVLWAISGSGSTSSPAATQPQTAPSEMTSPATERF